MAAAYCSDGIPLRFLASLLITDALSSVYETSMDGGTARRRDLLGHTNFRDDTRVTTRTGGRVNFNCLAPRFDHGVVH